MPLPKRGQSASLRVCYRRFPWGHSPGKRNWGLSRHQLLPWSPSPMSQGRTTSILAVGATVLLLASIVAHAAEYIGFEVAAPSVSFSRLDTVYVIGSVALVRIEPIDGAQIAAKLPIGTRGSFKGLPAEISSRPHKDCMGAEKHTGSKWSCVCFDSLSVEYGEQFCGWVSTDLLVKEEPKLASLLTKFDKTPHDDLAERRKWAERSVALEPLSVPAQQRLIDVLEKLGDTKALESAKRSFESYLTSQPQGSASKTFFYFGGAHLEPIAEIQEGQFVFRDFDQSTNYEFRGRGRFYNLYAGGKKVGTVVTEAQFDCRIQKCPQSTIARQVSSDQIAQVLNGLATNVSLQSSSRSPRKASKSEEDELRKIGIAMIKSSDLSAKDKTAFLANVLQAGSSPVLGIGSIGQDGQSMLIGNWMMGSMNDQHYGDPDDLYESFLIIAEQQQDGTFRLASGSGSIASYGCSYSNHLDVDGDGIDEILLSCDQLEGQYSFALVKRVDGNWRITYGPPRN